MNGLAVSPGYRAPRFYEKGLREPRKPKMALWGIVIASAGVEIGKKLAWTSPGQKPAWTQPSELQNYIFANRLDENGEVMIRGPGLHAHRPQSDSGMTELDEKPQGSLQQLLQL